MSARAKGEVRAAGFTLVEVLVGLALMAMILGLLAPVIFEARRALRFVDRSNSQTPIIAVQNYLRNALTQIHPARSGGGGDQSRLGLRGDDDTMQFTTSHATQGAYRGLYSVSIRTIPNGRGTLDLVAEEVMYRPDPAQAESAPQRQLLLLDNIAGVTFAYFKPNPAEGASPWQDEWPGSLLLPGLISIAVTFPAGDDRVWGALVVRPGEAGSSTILCPARVRCD